MEEKEKLTMEEVAQICHEANRALCEVIGDRSQQALSWENSPEWQRLSCLDGVFFHLANPLAQASASHQNWLNMKVEEGWVYGPVKDVDKKEHPCLVHFNELPKLQQAKDHLFKAVVEALREFMA